MFPLTSLPVQRAAPLWDTRILQAEVPPPPLVLGHSRGRCKSWKIWAVINDLRFNPVSWPGSDFLHLGVVEECLIVWDIVESKVVIGQDHLCKQQVVGGKTSLSRGENFNQGCLFVQKNLNPSTPIWDILKKRLKGAFCQEIKCRNSHWFAAIPSMRNKHTASAGLHHLLNVFRLLGKAPGKEKSVEVCDVILIVIFHLVTINGCKWWPFSSSENKAKMEAPGKGFLTAYSPNHCKSEDASRSAQCPTIIPQWRELVVAINKHTFEVRWESAQLGLPCLGTTALTT